MNKLERLKKAIAYLKGEEIISNQQDIVDQMEGNKSNISSALNGNEKYLTASFVRRFCKTFPIINKDWILEEKGDMLSGNIDIKGNSNTAVSGNGNKVTTNDISGMIELQKGYQEMIKEKDVQISKLITIIEKLSDK